MVLLALFPVVRLSELENCNYGHLSICQTEDAQHFNMLEFFNLCITLTSFQVSIFRISFGDLDLISNCWSIRKLKVPTVFAQYILVQSSLNLECLWHIHVEYTFHHRQVCKGDN